MKSSFLLAISLFFTTLSVAQPKKMGFPDVSGYITLTSDFHIHSVFSDGGVWPSIRVEEAAREGIDAIALTDHLEYQPKKKDIPQPDKNRPYELALSYAKQEGIIVVNGAEVTRSNPLGHANAIYLKDANALLMDDPATVIREAKKQDAFVFWNHPSWPTKDTDGMVKLRNIHKTLIDEHMFDGIEVANGQSFYPNALQIALDNNLTIMSTSDVHRLTEWDYQLSQGGHRPVTLIFAKERNAESIKEALHNRRTVAWFKNSLIGRPEHLVPLINASLIAETAKYDGSTHMGEKTVATVNLVNNSSASFLLQNIGKYALHNHSAVVEIAANSSTVIKVKTLQKLSAFDLKFKVLNALVAPDEHPEVSLTVTVQE